MRNNKKEMIPIKEANRPFAAGLQLLIEAKGLKQVYVAQKAGYTPQELNDMIKGRRLIKACDIPKLADAIGVTTDEIYKIGEQKIIKKEFQKINNHLELRKFTAEDSLGECPEGTGCEKN